MLILFATSPWESFQQFVSTGGWLLLPLTLCSLFTIALIIWKALELGRQNIMPDELIHQLRDIPQMARQGKLGNFLHSLQHDSSVLGRICHSAFNARHADIAAASRAAESTAREEIASMERGVLWLEVIFTTAPMLGLIGTVGGLIRIFGSIGTSARDAAQAQQIALGISEAMITTIAGLVVAIPALIGQVIFNRKIEAMALRMGTLVNDALEDAWHAASQES